MVICNLPQVVCVLQQFGGLRWVGSQGIAKRLLLLGNVRCSVLSDLLLVVQTACCEQSMQHDLLRNDLWSVDLVLDETLRHEVADIVACEHESYHRVRSTVVWSARRGRGDRSHT